MQTAPEIIEIICQESIDDLFYFSRFVQEQIDNDEDDIKYLLNINFIPRCILHHLIAAREKPVQDQLYIYHECMDILKIIYDPSSLTNLSDYLAHYKNLDEESLAYVQKMETQLVQFNQMISSSPEMAALYAMMDSVKNFRGNCYLIDSVGYLPCNPEMLNKAKAGQHDYYATMDGVGMAEMQGKRPRQEDRMIAAPLSENMQSLTKQSNQEIINFITTIWFPALHGLCDTLQTQRQPNNQGFFDPRYNVGSCFLGFFILPEESGKNRLISISLGDSILFILRANGQLEWVNQYQHSNNNPREIARIGSKNFINKRLGGNLAITGAFGDQYYRPYGLEVSPQVDVRTLEPGDRVIASCDGFT